MEKTTSSTPILITTTATRLSPELQGYVLARYISVVHKPVDLDLFLQLVQKTLALAIPSFVVDVLPKPFDANRLVGMLEKYAQPVLG